METRAARDVSSIREEASTLLRQATNVEADLRSVTRDIARLLRGPMSPDAVAKEENVPEHVASIGDFIIRGVKGEFYPCKPDIFAESYEPE